MRLLCANVAPQDGGRRAGSCQLCPIEQLVNLCGAKVDKGPTHSVRRFPPYLGQIDLAHNLQGLQTLQLVFPLGLLHQSLVQFLLQLFCFGLDGLRVMLNDTECQVIRGENAASQRAVPLSRRFETDVGPPSGETRASTGLLL